MIHFSSLVDYIAALKHHDWTFEYSDDGFMWRRGHDQLKALQAYASLADKDFSIWNANCPKGYERKAK